MKQYNNEEDTGIIFIILNKHQGFRVHLDIKRQ